jgi:hypothetical protein
MRRKFDKRSNQVWGRMFFAFATIPFVFIASLIAGSALRSSRPIAIPSGSFGGTSFADLVQVSAV